MAEECGKRQTTVKIRMVSYGLFFYNRSFVFRCSSFPTFTFECTFFDAVSCFCAGSQEERFALREEILYDEQQYHIIISTYVFMINSYLLLLRPTCEEFSVC